MRDLGRFTLDGSDALEASTRAVVAEITAAVDRALPRRAYAALVLLGGYGRGEGGVELRDGVERPHNNLDLLLIARHGATAGAQARLDPVLQTIARAHGIGVDLGVVSALGLRRSPCLVMWYDMCHGHKTLLGDDGFVPSLRRRFALDRIEGSDVRNLLTNRGTLLLVNDLLLERAEPTADERRTIVRHVMKAVIGYGDALLFVLGDYHWSYAEKRRRMLARADVAPGFRALYDAAIAFRFRPAYDAYDVRLGRDLAAWTRDVRTHLAPVHLATEARRLGRALPDWEGYLDAALAREAREAPRSLHGLARALRNAVHPQRPLAGLSPAAQVGLQCAGTRGLLPVLFPAVAYAEAGEVFRGRARRILNGRSAALPALRRAYLARWAVAGDTNFPHLLRRLSLDLDAGMPA